MRRSDALAPLSRDHHVALVVAAQLTRADEQTRAQATRRFVEFLANHEVGHFALEETLLAPAVAPGSPGEELVARMLEDHTYLRAALSELERAPQDATVARLAEIGERLRTHVRMEERELFPHLEQTLSEQQLDEIGARLAEAGEGH